MIRPSSAGTLAALFLAWILSAMPVHAQVDDRSAAVPNVVASIKPLQLIVSAVTEGISTPSLLIPANQSYHDFTLRPSTVRSLQDADLLVWIGPELETYLASSVAQKKNAAVVTALELPGLRLHPLEKAGVNEHADHLADDQHVHHGDFDGHIWLDTVNAQLIATTVAERLAELDPANAGSYQKNLEAFSARLASLRVASREATTALRGVSYAVYHDAFQYFEKENGLQHELVFVLTEDMQPGVRHILALREALQQRQPVCLLEDVTTNPATVRTVLGDYRLRRERVDVLGEQITPGADAYAQLIANMTRVFQRCVGGG